MSMSFETPASEQYTADNGLSNDEQAQVEPMAMWALGEIKSMDGWIMPLDDLVEALEEEMELSQAMVDEVLAYLDQNDLAVWERMEDGRTYIQAVVQS